MALLAPPHPPIASGRTPHAHPSPSAELSDRHSAGCGYRNGSAHSASKDRLLRSSNGGTKLLPATVLTHKCLVRSSLLQALRAQSSQSPPLTDRPAAASPE